VPKRQRDYKAEYRRSKEIARERGFRSQREYKKARKELSLPRRAQVSRNSKRDANKQWSKDHSRLPTSKWSSRFSDKRNDLYYQAFVKQYDNRADKLDALYAYLVDEYDLVSEDEWAQNYGPVSA
jgi:hypothetical protein